MKSRRRFGVLCVASALAVAVLMPAAPALAQSTTVIRACVQQSSLQTRIIGPNETCRGTESLVTWNQQGAVGAQGPKGDKGDPGTTRARRVRRASRAQRA